MTSKNRRVADDLRDIGPQKLPRVGDNFTMNRNGGLRHLEVISVEWDDEQQDVTIVLKPVITEEWQLANKSRVTVQDTQALEEAIEES